MADVQATDVWKAVLGELELQVTRPVYETWLRDTQGLSVGESSLTVGVSTPFAIEWLERRMYQLIQTTVERVADRPIEVQFQVGTTVPEGDGRSPVGTDDPQLRGRPSQHSPGSLNGRYNFSNFVVGPSNQLSYTAAIAVSEAPGQGYNPLFIYSGVGLGKTHLLHAIGHECVSQKSSFIYVTSEQFTNEFITAIRNRTTEEFRSKYRSVDVLLVDDIQFIIGKEQTQEVFFHTFNDLHNSNRQVVVTSDRPLQALSLLEDRLRSRFEWGLVADIQPPDLETRMAILRCKAEQMDVLLIDEVVGYVAKKIQKNVRELEGSLNRIVALARMTGSPVTIDLASEALANLTEGPSWRSVDPDTIMDQVSRRFKVSRDLLIGASRKKQIVQARHVAMYLLREELGMKCTEIARLLGGRNHATVISAVGKVNYEINVDPHLRQEVLDIKEAIMN